MPAIPSNPLMDNFCQKVLEGSFDGVKEICKSNGADFNIDYVMPDNAEEIQGLTALQVALWYQKYDIAQYLIDKCHADVNTQGADGMTPLYVAVNSLNEIWVDKLLTLGAKADIKVRLDRQPLERLKYIFNSGLQYYNKERLTSIGQKLIKNGADISNINDDNFLTACNPILTAQSLPPDFKTLNNEQSVTTEWPEFKNDVNNWIPVDNSMTGTVNIHYLIDTMASVPLWGVVLSIGTLIGITGLGGYCLKKRGSGSHKNRFEEKQQVELIARNNRGLFINEPNDQSRGLYAVQLLSASSNPKDIFR
ncbi:ankyrin repeat domain-containing protein [unidentified bacterial endosymbiont]|uniref:ankyrin repeat domain-containing protein n=1 Tax=unidentified bacterial endosymbiont TaxID=2355 RepID=UPI0020A0CD09|nr:ankyrin repeat domain-containing protein [unidentified bacterial endosymbiont]